MKQELGGESETYRYMWVPCTGWGRVQGRHRWPKAVAVLLRWASPTGPTSSDCLTVSCTQDTHLNWQPFWLSPLGLRWAHALRLQEDSKKRYSTESLCSHDPYQVGPGNYRPVMSILPQADLGEAMRSRPG